MEEFRTIEISASTLAGFAREAQQRGTSLSEVAEVALRLLRQHEMGWQLRTPLREDEHAWLADLD